MSQSKNAVELCTLLVDEMYGELTSQIYSVLLYRGRLPIPLICKYTHLGQRQVRHGLVVLVQQNLVYHNLDDDTGVTHYEASPTAAYALARSGKILEAVESRYGTLSRDVVQNLLLLGHTKISQLQAAYEVKQKQQTLNSNDSQSNIENGGVNGNHNSREGQIHTTGQFHSILLKLLQAGVLEEVSEHMFLSPSDNYSKVEKETLQLYFGGSTKGIKQKEELKLKARARLLSLRSNTQKWQMISNKRTRPSEFSNGFSQMSKRGRLSTDDMNEVDDNKFEDDGYRLDPTIVIRTNYEKCMVFLRNQKLIVTANDRIGKTTSLIYGEALRIIEDKTSRCQTSSNIDIMGEDESNPVFTTSELIAAIEGHKKINSKTAGTNVDKNTIWASEKIQRHRSQVDRLGPDVSLNSDKVNDQRKFSETVHGSHIDFSHSCNDYSEREKKMQHIKNHLMLLASDEFKFLKRCGNAGLGQWTVDFKEIVTHLRNAELDTVILETFGNSGHRLVRILRKFGKLDEKQLHNIALMKQKDVRTKLAELQMAGIVDIQEVPRDASNSIYRSFFLWYFDRDRVLEIYIDNVYKTMSRVFQRLKIERKKDEEVLRLTQRSDLRHQNPADYLDRDQLTQLVNYQAKEDLFLTQISRLDELIGIFRDY